MAAPKNRSTRRSQDSTASPSQQDEADIVAEVGAELDEESGDLLADEKKVLAAGAIDAESVRENRRLQNIMNAKRAGKKDVPFNAGDLMTKYDWLVKLWSPGTLDIGVKRLTGSHIQHIIMTRPKSAAELYGELMKLHGEHPEAKYEIKIVDSSSKEFRANGHIVLPDTQPQQGQGQPMQYPPPVYNPQTGQWYTPQPGQPGYTQVPQQGAPPQAQPQQPDPPQQPPAQVFVPPPPLPGPDPVAMMQQIWKMLQQPQQQTDPQQQGAPQQPPAQVFVPPPPPGPDPMAMMQQMFGMFQKMQPQGQPAQPGSVQPAEPQNPMAAMMGMMGAPPMTPPPGTIWVPGFGFMPLERLAQVFSGAPGAARGPYRPPYSGAPEGGTPAPYTPPSPPAPPKSAADQFQDAVSVVKTAVDMAQQVNALLPQQQVAAAPATPAEDDDSPVQIIDTGPMKILVDKRDGTLRTWETGWANMPKMMDWIAEQREAIQKANAGKQEEEEEAPKQLPPGYVEVKEGYEPPPGMVAVRVDPSQVPQTQGLAPPPANTPPPLQSTPPPNRTWAPPTVPTEGEG